MSDTVDLRLVLAQQARILEQLRDLGERLERLEKYVAALDENREATESCIAQMVETLQAIAKRVVR